MKKIAIAALSALLITSACKKKESSSSGSSGSGYRPAPVQTAPQARGSTNITIQAYYDARLFTINLMELSDKSAAEIIAHNKGLNEIYTTKDLDGSSPQDFVPVIDAVPADGFNPMWLQQIIVFNPGYTTHQFFSDDEIDDAVDSGEIHLENSGEVYRCAVIHSK